MEMEDDSLVNGTAAVPPPPPPARTEHWDPVIFYVEGVGITAVGAAGMVLNAIAVFVLARQGRII